MKKIFAILLIFLAAAISGCVQNQQTEGYFSNKIAVLSTDNITLLDLGAVLAVENATFMPLPEGFEPYYRGDNVARLKIRENRMFLGDNNSIYIYSSPDSSEIYESNSRIVDFEVSGNIFVLTDAGDLSVVSLDGKP